MALSSLTSIFQTVQENDNSQFLDTQIGTTGLTKRILRKGSSWQTPFPGDEVEVRFSGHVEGGACLTLSGDEGTPFKFKLGQGEVIKGWDEGVGTMKKGEKAMFTIPANMGYGEAGCPPLIPPNSTLIFVIEMVGWSTIRDVTGDGGVLKKITREGEGWATPRDTHQVLVKYNAWLENGVCVSKSDPEGLTFHVGDGHPCPAINKAVRTMRRGEKAQLSVMFSYGFQDGNATPNTNCSVPSDSKLTIDLELVSWKSVTDITGDGNVLKKINKVGEGHERPNEGSRVKVKYIVRHEDGSIVERKGTDEEPFEHICLEEQMSEGLDRAIMTMKKGEHASVTVGAGSCPRNQPVLHYEVELIDFTKVFHPRKLKEKPFWKMDTNEKLETCARKKQEGNVLFRAGKVWGASKKYDKAANFVEFSHTFSDDEKIQAKALWLSCSLNNAACKIKLQQYHEASKLCTKVLEVDPTNVKALYRRSQAFVRTSELEKAEADIKKALLIDPNNRDVKVEYKELKQKQREYAKYESEIFSTMFSK